MLNALLMVALLTPADTTFVFAESRRDMTGDSLEEHMVLLASGDPTDSLLMTFRIEGQDKVLYTDSFVVDRVIGFDAGRRVASEEEWERVLGYYRNFFEDQRFEVISTFVELTRPPMFELAVHLDILRQARIRSVETRLLQAGLSAAEAERQAQREAPWDMQYDTAAALRHWEQMVTSDVPVFRYSPGGDRSYSLPWSEELGQFVDLYPCC